jgi:hypothetical protein
MAAGDLCTLDQVKAYLPAMQNVTTDDSLLSGLITAISAFMATYCSRVFQNASYQESYSGQHTRRLTLRQFPVTAVSSLSISGMSIPASPDGVQPGYVWDQYGIDLIGYYFTRGRGNIAVSYTAGYSQPPADLSQACVELVALDYLERTRLGYKSKGVERETVTFITEPMPARVQAILDRCRRVSPPL